MNEPMKARVAVYDQLRKNGQLHNEFLLDAQMLGPCWIPNFGLKKDGLLPMAFEFDDARVYVEVYEISLTALGKIDGLMGLKTGFYRRHRVPTKYGPAFLYAALTSKMVEGHDRWFPDGVWSHHEAYDAVWLGWKREREILNQKLRDEALRYGYNAGIQRGHFGHATDYGSEEDLTEAELGACTTVITRPPLLESRQPTKYERCGRIRSDISDYKGDRLSVVEMG